ncbi:type II secretion system protein [Duganella sp. CT11-25]|uniref:type II secretion system protein n=1 Tax=unclassified Duganella TaxID=2636909 RepID=UPI0039B0456E
MQTQGGFSYAIVMFLVAVLSLVSTRALENSLTSARRDKEAELLWVGQAYRRAIQEYYQNTQGSDKLYPAALKDLLEDTRPILLHRPLRRLYRDPITGGDMVPIRQGGGESGPIIGVRSASAQTPLKTDGFPTELANFTNAASYQGWQFIYEPSTGK